MDAAIAANAVLGVTDPMSNGMGGDLFLLYWDAKSRQTLWAELERLGAGQTFRGVSGETRHHVHARGRHPRVTVPGAVEGWSQSPTRALVVCRGRISLLQQSTTLSTVTL